MPGFKCLNHPQTVLESARRERERTERRNHARARSPVLEPDFSSPRVSQSEFCGRAKNRRKPRPSRKVSKAGKEAALNCGRRRIVFNFTQRRKGPRSSREKGRNIHQKKVWREKTKLFLAAPEGSKKPQPLCALYTLPVLLWPGPYFGKKV